MMIGHVDIIGTKKLQKRKAKERATATKYGRTTTSTTVSEALVQEDVDESCDDNGADAVDDSSEEPQTVGTTLVASTKMRLPLPTVGRECDAEAPRGGGLHRSIDWQSINRCPDRCAASIISAVLQDVGISNEHHSSMGRGNKVRRELVYWLLES